MKVNPILKPLRGEQVIGVEPAMSPFTKAGWQRRLNLYTGRSLSETALTTEQRGRAGRLAMLGQTVSPGVLSGLEIGIEAEQNQAQVTHYLQIAAGAGLTAGGEDVVVPKDMRVKINDVQVYGPAALFKGLEGDGGNGPDSDPQGRPLRAGSTVGQLIKAKRAFPVAGVLVLEPVVIERVGEFDADDPCEEDPQNYAYEDWQLVDGCRLLYYAWPADLIMLPERGFCWRNRLAYAIFDAERNLNFDEVMPWEEVGVPIGMLAFDAAWAPAFVDRHSVVRAGGKPRRRSVLMPKSGTPFLWQARIQQFAEQVADSDFVNTPARVISEQFRYLPPAGLLPKDALACEELPNPMHLNMVEQRFFPSYYTVLIAPVPLEQLDVALESSASLRAYDTFSQDLVQVLVPVPQEWYEPDLLEIQLVDPEFEQTITTLRQKRDRLWLRRKDVREKFNALTTVMTGKAAEFPAPDPDALTDESQYAVTPPTPPPEPPNPPPAPPEEAYGTGVFNNVRFVSAFEVFKSMVLLKSKLKLESWRHWTDPFILPISPNIPPGKFFLMDRDGKKAFVVRGTMTDTELTLLKAANASLAAKQMLDEVKEESQHDEYSKLDQLGLEKFIEFLQEKVEQAHDRIDLGFLRVQTDIYRIRQLMLGNSAGTRLATSPALAAIAKGESAYAAKEDISQYLKSLKDGLRAVTRDHSPVSPIQASQSGAVTAGQVNWAMLAQIDFGALAGTTTNVSQPTSIPAAVKAQSGKSKPLARSRNTIKVIEKNPVIGKALDFRNVSIAERLEDPLSAEAKSFAIATKHDIVQGLAELNMNLDDIDVPGIPRLDGNSNVMFSQNQKYVLRTKVRFYALKNNLDRILDEPDPPDADEAAFFSAAVEILDSAVTLLRKVEGRIGEYSVIIDHCVNMLNGVAKFGEAAEQRLSVIGDDLAEARHDLSVARALLAEEQARVNAINEKRTEIISEHVRFLAYCRLRTADLLKEAPERVLEPALTEAPVPACLKRHSAVPAELRTVVDLFREVPIRWLLSVDRLLDRLHRLEMLRETVRGSKVRAQVRHATGQYSREMKTAGGRLGDAINKVYSAQLQVVANERLKTAQTDLGAFAMHSWKIARDRAMETVSLGDLIEGGHGRSDVAQQAAAELDDMSHVAACLYTKFGEAPPIVRLQWAEMLSQYDAPVSLRNLASLPRWGGKDNATNKDLIGSLDRREMQALVDWLYQRIDPRQPEAVSLVDDLVRICILLASHAPVNQIIAGSVAREAKATEGAQVELVVDDDKVSVGMQVFIYSLANNVVAQAVVEDLNPGQASARIVRAVAKGATIAPNSHAQFAEPGIIDITSRADMKYEWTPGNSRKRDYED